MPATLHRPAFHPWNKRHALRKKLDRASEAVLPYVFFAMAALVFWAAFVGARAGHSPEGRFLESQAEGR